MTTGYLTVLGIVPNLSARDETADAHIADMQKVEMLRVIGIDTKSFTHDDIWMSLYEIGLVNDFSSNPRAVYPCGGATLHNGLPMTMPPWFGIVCQSSRVEQIDWTIRRMRIKPSIDLNWLPSTLRRVSISHSQWTSEVSTRLLPRQARAILFPRCKIGGTVDLTMLPPLLESLDLSYNEITGTVRLTKLPRTMYSIDLMGCPISSMVVDNDALPEYLKEFRIAKKFPWSLDITELNDQPLDKRISFEEHRAYVRLG